MPPSSEGAFLLRVYLIAVPENQTEGAELAKFLTSRGVMVREEYGQFAYGPARPGELTLALWSRASMMSVRRVQLTNRAIDAWEQDSLVMARLEHGLSPHGLGDLEMIDLTFAAARMHHQERVLRALRDMETRQRDARLAQQEVATSAPPVAGSGGGEDSGGPRRGALPKARSDDHAGPPMAPVPPKMSRGGSGLIWLFWLLLLSGGAAFIWWLTTLEASMLPAPPPGAEVIGMRNLLMLGGGALLLLMALLLFSFGRGGKAKASRRVKAIPEVEEVAAAAPVSAEPGSQAAEPDVFVSYAHANSETVLPLASDLEAGGIGVWIDRDDIKGGQGWAGMIVRAIKSSGRFCLMCSAEAFASDHVRREVYLADKYGKPMLPVKLDDAPMPEDIEYFLIDRQWVDLTALAPDRRADALKALLAG